MEISLVEAEIQLFSRAAGTAGAGLSQYRRALDQRLDWSGIIHCPNMEHTFGIAREQYNANFNRIILIQLFNNSQICFYWWLATKESTFHSLNGELFPSTYAYVIIKLILVLFQKWMCLFFGF